MLVGCQSTFPSSSTYTTHWDSASRLCSARRPCSSLSRDQSASYCTTLLLRHILLRHASSIRNNWIPKLQFVGRCSVESQCLDHDYHPLENTVRKLHLYRFVLICSHGCRARLCMSRCRLQDIDGECRGDHTICQLLSGRKHEAIGWSLWGESDDRRGRNHCLRKKISTLLNFSREVGSVRRGPGMSLAISETMNVTSSNSIR